MSGVLEKYCAGNESVNIDFVWQSFMLAQTVDFFQYKQNQY